MSNSDAWQARWRGNKDFQIAITSCSQGVAIIDTVNQRLVEKAGAQVVARAAILAEGDAAKRDDILFLEPLPLFPL